MDDSGISQAIIANESGGQNLVSPQGAVGPGQIMPGTFAQYALPGEKISNPKDNLAVHARIISDYAQRWPGDPARVAVAYFSGPGNVAPPGSPHPWIRNVSDVNENVSKYVANALSAMPSRPATGMALTSTPMNYTAQPASAPGGVPGALAALSQGTGADGKGPSEMDSLKKMFPDQQQSSPAQQPQGQQQQMLTSMAGEQRQQQIAQQAQQMMALLQAKGAKPLSWGSQPYGSDAGLAPQGMTLNSGGLQNG